MGKETDLNSFVRNVNQKFKLEFVVLFGSRARKEALRSSDYDLLFVSDDFAKLDVFERIKEILDLSDKLNVEPICFTKKEFENKLKTYNAIVWMALAEGKVIFGEKNFGKYKRMFDRAIKEKKIVKLKGTLKFLVEPEIVAQL